MKKIVIGFIAGFLLCGILVKFLKQDPIVLPDPVIVTKIDTVYVEKQVVVYKTVTEAVIDTIYIDNQVQDVIASGDILIEQPDINGTLNIEYSYFTKLFTLRNSKLFYSGEIVTSETTKTEYVKLSTPMFKPLVSVGFGTLDEGYNLYLGAGVRIYNKIDIIIAANSGKEAVIFANWRF